MDKSSILVIEGDKAMKNLTATTLEMHNYRYTWADKGEQGILFAVSQWPDTILLGLGLSDMDRVGVILKTRFWTNTLIIVISARNKDSDKIATLSVGVDDYLTRPFSVDGLLAGFRSTQRRLRYVQSLKEAQSFLFTNGRLTTDYAAGCAHLDGEELHLTPYEYKLLRLSVHNVGKVLTHPYITREIWGAVWGGDVIPLCVFMAPLHRKIEGNPPQPQYIQTHVGVGYRMMKR